MRDSLTTVGTMAAIAVAAGVITSVHADTAATGPIPTGTPMVEIVAPALLPPATPSAVQPPSPVPVSPPALRTAPGIRVSVSPDAVPDQQVPPTVTSETVPPPCPTGLVLDHILGVCVSL